MSTSAERQSTHVRTHEVHRTRLRRGGITQARNFFGLSGSANEQDSGRTYARWLVADFGDSNARLRSPGTPIVRLGNIVCPDSVSLSLSLSSLLLSSSRMGFGPARGSSLLSPLPALLSSFFNFSRTAERGLFVRLHFDTCMYQDNIQFLLYNTCSPSFLVPLVS